MWYRGLSAVERVALKRKRIAYWGPHQGMSLRSVFVAPQWACLFSRNSDWLEWAVEAADAVSIKSIIQNKHLTGEAIHRIVTEPNTLMGIYKWFLVGEHPNVLPETVAELIVSDGLIAAARYRNMWSGLRYLRDSGDVEQREAFVYEVVSVAAFGPEAVSEPVLSGLDAVDLVAIFSTDDGKMAGYMLKSFMKRLLGRDLSKDMLAAIVGSPVVDVTCREEAFNRLYALSEVRVEFAGLPVGWVRRSFGFE